MKNMNGDELLDWMAVLDCQHVERIGTMPASMGDPMCARLMAGDGDARVRCTSCGQARRSIGGAHAWADDPWRAVTYAGLWDWARWEQVRDERWRGEHLRSWAHAAGRCPC